MLMKEQKACEFICHEMSIAPLDKNTAVHCRGSSCAAWRWLDSSSGKKGERRGYCGKVGKPLPELYER